MADKKNRLLLPGHSFGVYIGEEAFSFAKVSNLEAQIEYDAVVEGGNSLYPLFVQKARTKLDTLIMEKGVRVRSTERKFDTLAEGMHLRNLLIILYGSTREVEKVFSVEWGVIVRKQFSGLDAMKNELFVETLEIAHSGLVAATVPNK